MAILVLFLLTARTVQAFQHPGIPLTLADLSNLKTNITKSPWSGGYAAMVANGRSSASYTMLGPLGHIARNEGGTGVNIGLTEWENDMQAAYYESLMWYFTSNSAYAQHAHDILISWANTLTNFSGYEASFEIGGTAYHYAAAADILRGTWPGWTTSDTTNMQALFTNVYWPTLAVPNPVASGSQGGECILGAVPIAIFCDDTNRLNQALAALYADGDAGFRNTYANGETGDTGRDQGHAGLYVYELAWTAEVLWKQGIDVYSAFANRVHAVGEYYTRYNYAFQTNLTFVPLAAPFSGIYNYIGGSPGSGGLDGVTANIIHGAYAVRLGIQTPYIDYSGLRGWDIEGYVYYKVADVSTATPPAITNLPSTASLSTGLINANLNGSTPAGTTSYSGGVWTLTGGFNGGDPWSSSVSSDTVHFAYKQVTGDFVFIAKVNSVSYVNGHAKAGLMMRDSLTLATYRAYVAVTDGTTCERAIKGWSNLPYGSNSESLSAGILQVPYWVRLERVGNRVQAFTSYDGASWSGSVTADFSWMPSTMYVGLFNDSQSTGVSSTATFSNVRLTGGDGGAPLQTPPAPFAVYASPGSGQVPLHWNESFMATNYTVWRSTTNGGSYTAIATVTNAFYLDTNVAPSTTYYYVVTASNSAGTSAYSPQDSATTAAAPAAPTGLTVLPGNGQATLLWSASSTATSYNIYRTTTSGTGYGLVTNVTGASFIDTGLTNGTPYYYVVSAVGPAGESQNSSEAGVTPGTSAPTALFWSGSVNGSWNTTWTNWLSNGVPVNFQTGNAVIFDDSATGSTTVSNVVSVSPASVTFNNSSDFFYVYSSPISGSGSLTKLGSAEAFLASANSYTGGTTVGAGKLTIQNASALGSGALTLNGGIFDGYGLLTFANHIIISGSGNGIQLDSANNLTLSGTISGYGSLTLGNDVNYNSLYLSGPNTMSSGAITVAGNNNYVRFTSTVAGNANADWVFNNQPNHATFDFSSGTISFGSLSGNGSIQGNVSGAMNVTISVGANNNSTTFSGVIHNNGWGTGPIGLTKVGAGTLTLTGANDYTGATTVNAGELVISTLSPAKGNYTIANGATLGVTNVSSGSALVSNLTVAAGSALEFQNVASTATPLIAVSNVTVNGSCTLKITGARGFVAGNTYPLASYAGTLSGSFTDLQLQMPYGWRGTLVNSGSQILLSNVALVSTTPPLMNMTLSSQQLQLLWPQANTGWRLQAQTNALNSGLGTNWTDIPAAASTNQIAVPIAVTNGSVFFRLVYP